MIRKLVLTAVTLAFACSFTSVKAQNAEKLNQFGVWSALTVSEPGGKICYATSEAQKLEPTDRNHGKVLFFVTNKPSENTVREPSVTVGYNFKKDSEVSVDVDGTVFTMFTHEDSAWLKEVGTSSEAQLIEALKAGQSMVVSGESQRGTKVKYTFSLSGVTAAIKEIDKVCS